MKSCKTYIGKTIRKEFFNILKEADDEDVQKTDDEVLVTLNNTEDFLNDEEKQSKDKKLTASKLAGAVKNPAEKAVQISTQKAEDEKLKKIALIKKNIEQQTKALEDKIKSKQALQTIQNSTTDGGETSVSSLSISEADSKLIQKFPILDLFTEQNEELNSNFPNIDNANKAYLVKFDKNTQQPFDVKFTKRGFAIDGTRLSFEAIENALSKNYIITLNSGKGFVLTPTRMQQILKYKDKWF